jgi:hypothetical protein
LETSRIVFLLQHFDSFEGQNDHKEYDHNLLSRNGSKIKGDLNIVWESVLGRDKKCCLGAAITREGMGAEQPLDATKCY